jgi:Glycosyl transferases group 1
MKKILHIANVAPQYSADGIKKGFIDNGYEYVMFNWQEERFSLRSLILMRKKLIELALAEKPDLIFAHVQNQEAFDDTTWQILSNIGFVVNYTFDVRTTEESEWLYALAPKIGLTLFACFEDVFTCRDRGIENVGVLQSSIDMDWYKKIEVEKKYDVSFIGNNYLNTNLNFELPQERYDMVQFLKQNYGKRFLYEGMNWEQSKIVNPQQEVEIYNQSKIAINQNNFDRVGYTSDRLWRIMACGCFCLTKYFVGIENLFVRGVHLDWWEDFEQLKELIDFYLGDDDKRNWIASTGMELVRTQHNWTNRIAELKKLVDGKRRIITAE